MALRVDNKVPEYSGPALIWTLAAKNSMVLHMVCALGSLKLSYDSTLALNKQLRRSEAAERYGTALQLLASAIQNLTQVTDLDFILATLWLMISYDVAHGDGVGADLSVHLRGAALLLQGRLKTLCGTVHQSYCEHARSGCGGLGTRSDEEYFGITRLSSQLLLWIAIVDGSAALNGINATFNHLLGESMFDPTQDEASSRLSGFSIIQRYSTMVYRDVWDSQYPQSELIEDLQCSQIFCLQAESGQLRYMLSKVTRTAPYPQNGAEIDSETFVRIVDDVGLRYKELLTAASSLNLPKEGSQRRYVLNLRTVVPLYHAMVLLLYCIFGTATTPNDKQRLALREIITLASQVCADEGNQALCKLAWPLFIAALETDDMLHRNWVLEQFEALSKQGENFRRAHKALSFAFFQRRPHRSRITYWQLVGHKEIEPFVLE
ncbi:fungal-specific transcription factor domain-containing protein [Aspergillus californicus]